MSKLIYCATPSKLVHKIDEIMDFVTNKGYAPLHPFQAFPYERFEGNKLIGRQKSMEWCLRLVDISDEFWLFGISKGTLEELNYTLKNNKPIKLHMNNFDLDWEKFYRELCSQYDYPLSKIA